MKAWTRIAGRPVGREPAVYLVKPPQCSLNIPWSWEVEEWDSVQDAINAVLDYLSPEFAMENAAKGIKEYLRYYNDFKFITKLENNEE